MPEQSLGRSLSVSLVHCAASCVYTSILCRQWSFVVVAVVVNRCLILVSWLRWGTQRHRSQFRVDCRFAVENYLAACSSDVGTVEQS